MDQITQDLDAIAIDDPVAATIPNVVTNTQTDVEAEDATAEPFPAPPTTPTLEIAPVFAFDPPGFPPAPPPSPASDTSSTYNNGFYYWYDFVEIGRKERFDISPGWILHLPDLKTNTANLFIDPRIPASAYGCLVMVTFVGKETKWVNVVLCVEHETQLTQVFPPGRGNASSCYVTKPVRIETPAPSQGTHKLAVPTLFAGMVNYTIDLSALLIREENDMRSWVPDLAMFYQLMNRIGENVMTDHRDNPTD